MFEIQNYTSFVAAIILFQLIPGAGTIVILNSTARNGIGAGFGSVWGTLTGDFIYMVAAVAGLAAVMNANPILFRGLQWFGTAYICWMGFQLLRTRVESDGEKKEPARNGSVYFRQAFTVSLTNPKVVLFFVAFFPLFLKADASPMTLGVMMAHVTIISFIYQAGLVFVGNAVARRLSDLPYARRLATRIAGITLIGFGVKLALGNR